MKNILFIFFALVLSLKGIAQQEMQTTQFMLNPFLLNPAYSSVDDNLDAKIGYRSQWVGIEGAPETAYLSVHTPIGKPRWGRTHPGDFHNWHGTGLVVMQDKIGAYNNLKINANYSYNLKISSGRAYGYQHKDGVRLSVGAFVGMNQYKADTEILSQSKNVGGTNTTNTNTLNDPSYSNISSDWNQTKLNISLGAMLYFGEKYYIGASSTQLLENTSNVEEIGARISRHYFLTGLAKFETSDDFYVIPSAIFKVVEGAPLSWNLNCRLDWRDKFYAGLGYRSGDALIAMLGAQIRWGEKVKNFRVSKNRYMMQVFYSYDYTISALGDSDNYRYSKGAHEITLSFLLPPKFKERNASDTW